MEKIMTDIMYTVPSDPTISKVVVTGDCVRNSTEPLVIHSQPRARACPDIAHDNRGDGGNFVPSRAFEP